MTRAAASLARGTVPTMLAWHKGFGRVRQPWGCWVDGGCGGGVDCPGDMGSNAWSVGGAASQLLVLMRPQPVLLAGGVGGWGGVALGWLVRVDASLVLAASGRQTWAARR